MPTTFNYSGKPAFMYDQETDQWLQLGGAIDTSAGYTWTGVHAFSSDASFADSLTSREGINNFLNPAARDAAITSPVHGTVAFLRQDAGGSTINQWQYYNGSAWVANDGDISGVTAGTGLSGGGTAGSVTLSVDTTFVATTSNTMTLSNKTLTAPLISGGTSTTVTEAYPVLLAPEERWNVTAESAGSTVNLDVLTSAVWYYTNSSSSNWTLNVRGNSSTSLNNILATGDSITTVFFATNGTTPFYQTLLTVDGATSGVSVKWQNGTAPAAGNTSSIDIYSFTIVKTGSAAFTAFGSQTKFS